MKAFKLPFGVKGGLLVRVSEVVSGLRCGCVCPGCGGVLVARKGEKVEHHFAHHSVDDCAGCEHCLGIGPGNAYIQCGGHHAASGGS